jgi:hypothetical protein
MLRIDPSSSLLKLTNTLQFWPDNWDVTVIAIEIREFLAVVLSSVRFDVCLFLNMCCCLLLIIIIYLFFVVLRLELQASCLLSKLCTLEPYLQAYIFNPEIIQIPYQIHF